MAQHIRVAHSPDSDDAFMFCALATGKIDTSGYTYEHILSDIQTLNEEAQKGTYEVTAVSIHAYAQLHRTYALMNCGASMGETDYGPVLVSAQPMSLEEAKTKTIAVPGMQTSAYLALKLALGDVAVAPLPFNEIDPAVKRGDYSAGVLIHEGQLTFEEDGLHEVLNFGRWWGERTGGLPLPLGGNVVRRNLGEQAMRDVTRHTRESIEWALANRDEALDYAMRYARDLPREQADRFVGWYVNQRTVDYGEEGRESVRRFLGKAAEKGYIDATVEPDFIR